MFIEENGKLYDVHEDCAEAGVCQHCKTKDEFSGCQFIGKGVTGFYCVTRPEHPEVKLEAVQVECK